MVALSPVFIRPSLSALVQATVLTTLMSLGNTAACAGESYLSVGVPGVLAGYAYSVNTQLGLRADVGTSGTYKKTDTASGLSFDAKAKYNRIPLPGASGEGL